MKCLSVVTFLTILLVTGCASVGHKLDESKIDQIKKGITTRDQVIKLVGSPDQITRIGSGMTIFQYVYAHSSATATTYIPIVGAFAGGANVQTQMLSVTFDTNNVVCDFFSTYGGNQVDTGLNTSSAAQMPDVQANKRP